MGVPTIRAMIIPMIPSSMITLAMKKCVERSTTPHALLPATGPRAHGLQHMEQTTRLEVPSIKACTVNSPRMRSCTRVLRPAVKSPRIRGRRDMEYAKLKSLMSELCGSCNSHVVQSIPTFADVSDAPASSAIETCVTRICTHEGCISITHQGHSNIVETVQDMLFINVLGLIAIVLVCQVRSNHLHLCLGCSESVPKSFSSSSE